MKIVGTHQPKDADDDQIDGDDIVQQARSHQNENSSDQRYQGTQTQIDGHDNPPKTFNIRTPAATRLRGPLRSDTERRCARRYLAVE